MSQLCIICNSAMEEGFLLERGDVGVLSSEVWVTGAPEKSLFSGVSLKGKQVYNVKTFRCTRCGYLESFALDEI